MEAQVQQPLARILRVVVGVVMRLVWEQRARMQTPVVEVLVVAGLEVPVAPAVLLLVLVVLAELAEFLVVAVAEAVKTMQQTGPVVSVGVVRHI
jgi:hypothetical protein